MKTINFRKYLTTVLIAGLFGIVQSFAQIPQWSFLDMGVITAVDENGTLLNPQPDLKNLFDKNLATKYVAGGNTLILNVALGGAFGCNGGDYSEDDVEDWSTNSYKLAPVGYGIKAAAGATVSIKGRSYEWYNRDWTAYSPQGTSTEQVINGFKIVVLDGSRPARSSFRITITGEDDANLEISELQLYGVSDQLGEPLYAPITVDLFRQYYLGTLVNPAADTGNQLSYGGTGVSIWGTITDFMLGARIELYPVSGAPWFQYEFPAAVVAGSYSLGTHKQYVTAIPTSWNIEAGNDGIAWNIVDQRTDVVFPFPNDNSGDEKSLMAFNFNNTGDTPIAYKYYRIVFLANGGHNSINFAGWQLFEGTLFEENPDLGTAIKEIDTDAGVIIYVQNGAIHVKGATGNVIITSMSGISRVVDARTPYYAGIKGVYIVHVNGKAYKVIIQ
jgi:hypothetical protein